MHNLHKGGMNMRRQWLHHGLAGILIGIACILPGASGGVIAVSFGLYRPMLDAIMHFFRSPRQHLRLLLPLGAGIGAGIMLGAACLCELNAIMNAVIMKTLDQRGIAAMINLVHLALSGNVIPADEKPGRHVVQAILNP